MMISTLVAIVLGHAAASPSEPVRVIVRDSTLDIDGRAVPAFKAETADGQSIIRGRKGERFRIELVNQSSLAISMHPHGAILPSAQDGVPYITQLPVAPGGTFAYDFVPVQAGSYFFHSHFGWELQDQLAIPLIFEDAASAAPDAPRDVVMMLSDVLFRSPPAVFESLKSAAKERSASPGAAPNDKPMPSMPSMPSTPSKSSDAQGSKPAMAPDLNDVEYDAVLANRRTISNPEIVRAEPGSRIRLRLINGSSASNFLVELGGLRGRVIAVDGEPILPVDLEKIELAIAQRVDAIIELPKDFTSAAIVAQGEGSTLHAAIVVAAPGASAPSLPPRAAKAIGAIGVDSKQEKSFRAANPLRTRPVDKSFKVALTGSMSDYTWSLNDQVWPSGPPMTVKKGDRVELVFENRTMMSHPMHLHGHRFQVTEIDGVPLAGAVRDTVLVMPKSTVKIQFDADAPGHWMMHCHITWHEAAGMLGIVEYEGVPKPEWYRSKDTFNEPSSLRR